MRKVTSDEIDAIMVKHFGDHKQLDYEQLYGQATQAIMTSAAANKFAEVGVTRFNGTFPTEALFMAAMATGFLIGLLANETKAEPDAN